MRQSELIEMKVTVGKGRGVFARKAIKKGQTIEHIPVLIIPASALVDGLNNSSLCRFYYYWTKDKLAIALGYGSLYNHSFSPNATYSRGRASIIYTALKNIEPGEEIVINYNRDPKDKSAVGFKVVK